MDAQVGDALPSRGRDGSPAAGDGAVERASAAAERSSSRMMLQGSPAAEIDEVDQARALQYGLLALLLRRAPNAGLLGQLSDIRGDASPLGLAQIALGQKAAAADPAAIQREFFDLFVGVGRGELLPFASFYQTGFLYDRPLALLRQDLERIGLAADEALREPEDHIATLCECMAGFAGGRFPGDAEVQRRFFERHLKPWAARFFADLETAKAARFYRVVGTIGRMFVEIEAEAFEIDA